MGVIKVGYVTDEQGNRVIGQDMGTLGPIQAMDPVLRAEFREPDDERRRANARQRAEELRLMFAPVTNVMQQVDARRQVQGG